MERDYFLKHIFHSFHPANCFLFCQIGDPLQMPPICMDPICKRLGYEESLLSRLLGCFDLLRNVPIVSL